MVLNESNFNEVLESEEPYLVDFWASWCGPCLVMSPVIDEIGKEKKVGKVNVAENQELAAKYGVSALPTFIVFKGGEKVQTLIGVQTKESLLAAMES